MLLDLVTLVLILQSQNELAAKQFLQYLTTAVGRPDSCPPSADYPKTLLLKAAALVPGGQEWLLNIY
jgi:hypothetical protein